MVNCLDIQIRPAGDHKLADGENRQTMSYRWNLKRSSGQAMEHSDEDDTLMIRRSFVEDIAQDIRA